MFDEDDEDEHGTFGMLAGFALFLIVSGLLIGSSTMPPSQAAQSQSAEVPSRAYKN